MVDYFAIGVHVMTKEKRSIQIIPPDEKTKTKNITFSIDNIVSSLTMRWEIKPRDIQSVKKFIYKTLV